jgi:putative tryptophan/tyrosine transport system substrate-binding protein
MRRRKFIALLGGAACAWPLAASAQHAPMPVVGLLHPGWSEPNAKYVAGFRQGLGETGFIEGQNIAIEYRWGQGDSDRLPELAADLVGRRVAAIVTPGSIAAGLAAKAATKTIPIVYASGADPVEAGLVASLNRPGGNITGISSLNQELSAKTLGLLRQLLQRDGRVAFLVNSNNPRMRSVIADAQAAAATTGQQIEVVTATTPREFKAAFAEAVTKRADALLISPDPLFTSRAVQLAILAAQHRLPTIYTLREFAEAGGLISYGSNFTDMYRHAGIYTGRILNCEKPADLPILLATKFELVLNLQTADALGLEIPAPLLALADEVIE